MELKAAAERLEALSTVLDDLVGMASGSDVELFLRESTRSRVAWTGGSVDRITCHDVHEHGCAVRVVDRTAGRTQVGFSATTGSDVAALCWALERASADRADIDDDPCLAEGHGEVQFDVDDGGWNPPDVSALRDTRDAVIDFAGDATRVTVDAGWIETGRTVEWLVSSRGVQAVRRRLRTWTLFECGVEVQGARFRRPLIAAVRGPRAPDVSILEATVRAWSCAAVDSPAPSGPVGFGPSAAGLLIRSLGAGPGVTDRPADGDALFGGTHDDCGYPTAGRVGWWRGSFRDPPLARPAHLVVESRPAGVNPAARIEDLRIHRVDARSWILEGIAEPLGRVRLRIDPRTLADRWVGTIGNAQVSHHGVTTPGLVFDLS